MSPAMDTPNFRRLARVSAIHIASDEPEMRTTAMTNTLHTAPTSNTSAWLTFTYIQFGVAAAMTALGVWAMPVDLMVKGYLIMSSVFLVGSAFTLAKTVRDEHESRRFASRIDEARTEKLLMEVGRN